MRGVAREDDHHRVRHGLVVKRQAEEAHNDRGRQLFFKGLFRPRAARAIASSETTIGVLGERREVERRSERVTPFPVETFAVNI